MITDRNICVQYFAGLDLAQPHEFTGLAVLERTLRREHARSAWSKGTFAIRHLERFALGTSYPDMGNRLRDVFEKPPLNECSLTIDKSAVGNPVLEMLKQALIKADFRSVIVSAGHSTTFSEGAWLVPKQELISTVQVLLQTRRLKVAAALADVPTFIEELLNFKMKVKLATADLTASWREGPNDDLVLAVAIAAWQAERSPPPTSMAPYLIPLSGPWRR